MKYIKNAILILTSLLLCACNGFFDKDNTPTPFPLVPFKPEITVAPVWKTNTGAGAGNEDIKLVLAVTNEAIFTGNKNGTVVATDKTSGKSFWKTNTKIAITGGPAANDGLVVVAGADGTILALSQTKGEIIWQTKTSSQILAAPAIQQGIVIIKTIDGKVIALSEQDGHFLWQREQTEPSMILRAASAPKMSPNAVIVGFANGNLVKYALQEGLELWQKTIAFPEGSFAIQRMIDIDADPIIVDGRIYVATYQGEVSALSLLSGKPYWSSRISSYTGIAADSQKVYVSDASSIIWAFNAETGSIEWKQGSLQARNISGPAIIGNYIVVGDEKGYLHWLRIQDGHFAARIRVSRSAIVATPVVDNNILYVVTKNGDLAAYTLDFFQRSK